MQTSSDSVNSIIDDDGLIQPAQLTRTRLSETPEQHTQRLSRLSSAVRTILECIGEDPDREGLIQTPMRYAKALLQFTRGYQSNIHEIVNNAVFQENHDEMVIVKNINVFSLCEHHLVPISGTVSIGYIPDSKVIGLSKLARIADIFAKRLQVQERMTRQIAEALMEILEPQGVAVVMKASHFCMNMRGVEKYNSETITSSMQGVFKSSQKTREEFLTLINR